MHRGYPAKARAEEHIVAQVIHAGNEVLQGKLGAILRQRKLPRIFGKTAALEKRKCHVSKRIRGIERPGPQSARGWTESERESITGVSARP